MNNRKKEIAVIILMTNITFKLGNDLTKRVNEFRRSLRKYLNRLIKHEKSLYDECLVMAEIAWDEAYNNRDMNNDLSIASTLNSLNLLVEDVKWIKTKIYTQKQFVIVYASITQDKPAPLTVEIEQASLKFTNKLAKSLEFEQPNQLRLKRMIHTLKQNNIIDKG